MLDTDTNTEKVAMHLPTNGDIEHHSHVGPILGVLVVMLVLIFGGLFLWGSMLDKEAEVLPEPPILNNEPETPRAIADQQILETLSPSDELDAIDADLGSSNFDSIDADMTTIDAELNAAFGE